MGKPAWSDPTTIFMARSFAFSSSPDTPGCQFRRPERSETARLLLVASPHCWPPHIGFARFITEKTQPFRPDYVGRPCGGQSEHISGAPFQQTPDILVR